MWGFYFLKYFNIMDNIDFQNAVKSVLNKDYSNADIKIIKHQLNDLLKKEVSIKQKIEKETSEFLKTKNKLKNEIKTVQNDIKDIRNILKKL